MRTKGESAIYLCGTCLDNDYGFGSNDIGTAISALPEDGDKAAEPCFHPGSTEVYIIFQGSLCIETLNNGFIRHPVEVNLMYMSYIQENVIESDMSLSVMQRLLLLKQILIMILKSLDAKIVIFFQK